MKSDDWDKFLDKLNDLENLDGQSLDSFNSNIPFSPFQKLSSTPEEALDQARVDAIKRGQDFIEKADIDMEAADDSAAEKYIDDLLDELL